MHYAEVMCGRFAQTTSSEDLVRIFQLIVGVGGTPRYNLAPTQQVVTIRSMAAGMMPQTMHWGFVPSWAPDMKRGASMINARSETVFEKRSFAHAARHQRCIIPASGFYEWRNTPAGKMPTLFLPAGDEVFRFAALWSTWADDHGEVFYTTTILTTEANIVLRPFHHRMPALLDKAGTEAWIEDSFETPGQLSHLLRTAPPEAIKLRAVSQRVNSVRNDDPDCWSPPFEESEC